MTLTPPFHLYGRAGRGRILLGWMIEETIQSEVPNYVLMPPPPPFQLTQLNNCYPGHTLAPSPSSVPAIAQGFSPTVSSYAGPMTPPVPIATSPTIWWPTSSVVPLIPRIWPWGICGWHPSRSPNSWQGSHSSATCRHCRSILTPFLHNLHSSLLPGHQQDHIILISPMFWDSSPLR